MEEKHLNEAGSPALQQAAVMRSVTEALERIKFNDKEIKFWSTELQKTLKVHHEYRNEGYVQHCRDLISDLQSDTKALKWVYGLL
jgi:hypothetical protein